MYAAASNKLKNDEKDGRAAAVSSDDEGSTTAVTTKVLPSSTSPKDFHPFTGGRFVEAGCHSKVFCFYDEDERVRNYIAQQESSKENVAKETTPFLVQ